MWHVGWPLCKSEEFYSLLLILKRSTLFNFLKTALWDFHPTISNSQKAVWNKTRIHFRKAKGFLFHSWSNNLVIIKKKCLFYLFILIWGAEFCYSSWPPSFPASFFPPLVGVASVRSASFIRPRCGIHFLNAPLTLRLWNSVWVECWTIPYRSKKTPIQ